MRASERTTRTFLSDTNVFVAAIRNPRRETATLRFVLALLERDDIQLVGNVYWVEEMLRYAEEFRSETAAWLVAALLGRVRVVPVSGNFVAACARYVTTPDRADLLHAATCLQERPVLISNDKHFDRIRDAGVVEVWILARAIRSLGRPARREGVQAKPSGIGGRPADGKARASCPSRGSSQGDGQGAVSAAEPHEEAGARSVESPGTRKGNKLIS